MQLGEPSHQIEVKSAGDTRTEFQVAFYGHPLTNARIRVTLSNGQEMTALLDDNGRAGISHPPKSKIVHIKLLERRG